jgi:hypothetical protein
MVRPLLLRALLREFGIAVRREQRMMDVYLLQLSDDGQIRLEQAPEGDPAVGGIELIGDDRVWLGHGPESYGKYIEQWLDRPVVNDTGLESHGWNNAYRYAEPYPHPPGHDPAAHFLEQSGLRLVPGQREVELTIVERVEPADPSDAPRLMRPHAVELQPYELTPLDAQLGRLPESAVDVEDLADLQGFWEYTEGTLVRDLHIIGDLVLIPGTGQPWLDALAGWPEEVQALVKSRTPRVERALRVLAVQPTANGLALTVAMDATGRPFYVLIDVEDDRMQMMMGSAPAELTFEGDGVRTARLHRVGPSPLADAVAATMQE